LARDRVPGSGSPFGVIADDLTGACDVAGAFAAAGMSAVVELEGGMSGVHDADVVVVDADARGATDAEAASRLRGAIALLAERGAGLDYLKVDSTLRGPVRALVAEALASCPAKHAVVATAFPAQGRVVRGGRLLVSGRDVGVDVLDVFGSYAAPVLLESLVDPGASPPVVAVLVEQDDAELAGLARWRAGAADRPLLVGSAGLAQHVARMLAEGAEHGSSGDQGPSLPVRGRAGWTLVVCGSPTSESARQMAALKTALDGGRVRVDEEPVVLASTASPDRDDGSTSISLALEAKRLVESRRSVPSAVLLVGGDTGRAVLEAFGVRAVRVGGEVSAGLPMGIAIGGALDGVPVATKAGGFGGDGVLIQMLEALQAEPLRGPA